MRYDLLLQPLDPLTTPYDDGPLRALLGSRPLKLRGDGMEVLCLPSGEVEIHPLVEGGRTVATQLRVPLSGPPSLVREAVREGLVLASTAGLRLVDPQLSLGLSARDESAVVERYARTAGYAIGQAQATASRGLARIHRDTWRTLLAVPSVFVALPMLAWLALDGLAIGLSTRLPADQPLLDAELSLVDALLRFFLEAWILAVLLSTTKLLATGTEVSFPIAIRAGNTAFVRTLSTIWSMTWRVTLGLVLFVVPGVVLATRYALALPITVFGESSGAQALSESQTYVGGQWWRLFGYATAMSMIYAYVGGLPGTCLALAGVELDAITSALVASPFRLIFSLLTIEAVLIYADTRASLDSHGPAFAAPIGLPSSIAGEASLSPSFRSSGRLGLTLAIVAAVTAAAAQAYLVPIRLQQAREQARQLKSAE